MLGRRSHEGSSWTSKLPQQPVRVVADRALDDTTLPLGSRVLPDRDVDSETSDGCLLVGSRRIFSLSLGCAAEVRTMSWLEKMQLKHLTATQKPEICADSSFPRRTVKISGVERVKHMLSPERVLACNSEEDAVDTDAEGLWGKVWRGCDGVRLEITKASDATIATWTSMPTTAVDNFTSLHG